MKIYNDNTNWILKEYDGIKLNIILCLSSEEIPDENMIKSILNNSYEYKRINEYASVEEQFDMQYHDIVDKTTTWKDHIKGVKTKYPKN